MKVSKFLLPIIIVLGVTVFQSIFIVQEINQAIVLQFGDPKKIAKTIDFLLDAHNNWMTGQVVRVDGGMNNLK